jgi:site-specific DNA recombinase
MDDIEQAVFQYLQDILDGRISGQELSVSNPNSPITSTERELDSSRKELARLSEKFDRQVVAYENGILDIEQLRQAKSRLENDKSAITRRIQELEKVLATGTKVIPIGDIRTNLTRVLAIAQNTSVPIPERRAALAEVIDVITYSKNHDLLRITLKA